MKKIKTITVVFAVSIILISMLALLSYTGAAGSSSGTQAPAKSVAPAGEAPADGATTKELASSYTLRLLFANTETPVETVTFTKDDTGTISAIMVCEKYGKQEIPVVYFDGEVLKFIALAGSNHDEHFYFELKFYGTFLIGEAEGGRGPIPVIAKDTKDTIYW